MYFQLCDETQNIAQVKTRLPWCVKMSMKNNILVHDDSSPQIYKTTTPAR